MEIRTKEIYSEVYSILNMLGDNYISKLPTSLFNMIKNEKLNTYNPKYDLKINLKDQNIQRETLAMLALLHLNYWCKTNEEKEQLSMLFKNNEEKRQKEIREKYNPDNLFKDKEIQSQQIPKEVALVPVNESFFTKLLKKIKNIFHRN